MKNLMIWCFCLLVIPVCAQHSAKQGSSPYGTARERAKLQTERMKTALSLRPDQLDPVYAINLKYAEIMQREVLDQGASQWTMYTKGNEINKRKEKELKPLLSEAQLKNYEKLKAEMRKKLLTEGMPSSLEDFRNN